MGIPHRRNLWKTAHVDDDLFLMPRVCCLGSQIWSRNPVRGHDTERISGARILTSWRIHNTRLWEKLQEKKRWETKSSQRQKEHLEANGIPKRCRRSWVGVFWSIKCQPKHEKRGREMLFQIKFGHTSLFALGRMMFQVDFRENLPSSDAVQHRGSLPIGFGMRLAVTW